MDERKRIYRSEHLPHFQERIFHRQFEAEMVKVRETEKAEPVLTHPSLLVFCLILYARYFLSSPRGMVTVTMAYFKEWTRQPDQYHRT